MIQHRLDVESNIQQSSFRNGSGRALFIDQMAAGSIPDDFLCHIQIRDPEIRRPSRPSSRNEMTQ